MPPRDIHRALLKDTLPRDTDRLDAKKPCAARDSELIVGVIIPSLFAFVLLVILCQTLMYCDADMKRRDAAERKVAEATRYYEAVVADQKNVIASYSRKWGPVPRNIVDEEARDRRRHADPGVRVVVAAAPEPEPEPGQSRVLRNGHHGVSDQGFDRTVSPDDGNEGGPYMSGADGGATIDRFLAPEAHVPESARIRVVPDEPSLFVVGEESDDGDDEDSAGGGLGSSGKRGGGPGDDDDGRVGELSRHRFHSLCDIQEASRDPSVFSDFSIDADDGVGRGPARGSVFTDVTGTRRDDERAPARRYGARNAGASRFVERFDSPERLERRELRSP